MRHWKWRLRFAWWRLKAWMQRRLPAWLVVPLVIVLGLAVLVLLVALTLAVSLPLWLRYLWWKWFPPPATRDVSRLDDEDAGLDVVKETIEDEGKPLKPHHRRRIFRDPRLLPKPQPPPNVWPRPKRKKVMPADEANRLFSTTMRTRDRHIRDLLPDEEQLKRLELPVWRTEADVADALGLTVKQLRHFSIHRDAEPVCHYVTFVIPKRNGRPRYIHAPKTRLKQIQRALLRLLVDNLPVSDRAHGFRKGRSIRTGAGPHVGKAIVLGMDLKDFFPSVTFGRVRGLLIACGYGYAVATTIAVLLTEALRQPVEIDGRIVHVPVGPRHCVQGAPTSPGLCNAIALRMDRRLAGLASKYGWDYTRYADDLAFSGNGDDTCRTIRRLTTHICRSEGFEINPEKTRVQRKGRLQTVTGVVVNDVAGLSRKERRQLRAAIHRHTIAVNSGDEGLSRLNSIRGKLAYLKMLNPKQAARLESLLSTGGHGENR